MVGKVRTAAWYMAVVSGDQGGNQSSMTTGNLSSGDGVGLRSADGMDGMASNIFRKLIH